MLGTWYHTRYQVHMWQLAPIATTLRYQVIVPVTRYLVPGRNKSYLAAGTNCYGTWYTHIGTTSRYVSAETYPKIHIKLALSGFPTAGYSGPAF